MGEYTRKQRTVSRETGSERNISTAKAGSIPNSTMEAIMAGRAKASSEMMGHRQDLAPSLNTKMAKAFGMDLSGMQVYRSDAMSGTGTEGLASGNRIVLSSDIDLNSTAGQAVLGHEISHIHAQNQGIGMGHSGLYQNAGLEHQADVEGMMAARGQSILGENTGMDMGLGMGGIGGLTPLGPGMSASAGAPMQASGKGKSKKNDEGKYKHSFFESLGVQNFATGLDFDQKGAEAGDEKNGLIHYNRMSGPGQGTTTLGKVALGVISPLLIARRKLGDLNSYRKHHTRSGKAISDRADQETANSSAPSKGFGWTDEEIDKMDGIQGPEEKSLDSEEEEFMEAMEEKKEEKQS